MGTGHVMRCLALAEALGDVGHTCAFLLVQSTRSLDARIAAAGFAVHRAVPALGSDEDAAGTAAVARDLGAAALVLDGYRFGPAFRRAVRSAGRPVLVFDDLADSDDLCADLVVNPAPQAARLPYGRVAPEAELLLGPAYAMVRREIRDARSLAVPFAERRSLLLTFGGSDPLGLTGPCMVRLAPALPPGGRLTVVVGGANPRADAIGMLAVSLGSKVEVHFDTARMGALMAASGLAVSAAGGTTGELAALGVPTVLVTVAENQRGAAAESGAMGWCRVLDGAGADAPDRIAGEAARLWAAADERERMAAAAAGLLDAEGARRVAEALIRRIGGRR